jgi:hypothetical protein
MKTYKTIIENGTKMYLVKYVGEECMMPTGSTWMRTFISGEVYKIYKMKQGGFTVKGNYKYELGNIKESRTTLFKSQFDPNSWEYIKN